MMLFTAVLTAGLLWLAFPGGGGCWPLLFVALIPFLLLLREVQSARQAGILGLLTGIVHFLVLLYWLVTVLGHYGGLPLYVAVPALVLLALYMSLYTTVFALLTRYFFLRFPDVLTLWLLPALWVMLDWCRSFFFTGFPWMDLGYALGHVPGLIQSADLWGHHGLSFLLVLVNTLAVLLVKPRHRPNKVLPLLVPAVLAFSMITAYSFWRWPHLEQQMQSAKTLRMGIVQGNIPQDVKWSPQWQRETLERYLVRSRELVDRQQAALLVWPETALPFYPLHNPLLQSVQDFAVSRRVALLTGAPWAESRSEVGQEKNYRFANSALLFAEDGRLKERYSKSHLVPFGEYVPLKRFLPFLAPLVESVGDFSPGRIERTLPCQDARIGVLICFESVFPDISRKWVDAGANVLANLTNDAWYGRSSAPHHSLVMTVLRAVETRRSLVRSANTGFSGFIDPLGRIQSFSPLFTIWAETADVSLMEEKTWFVRVGYLFPLLCSVMVMLVLGGSILRSGRS